jgi:hypothetical protein
MGGVKGVGVLRCAQDDSKNLHGKDEMPRFLSALKCGEIQNGRDNSHGGSSESKKGLDNEVSIVQTFRFAGV